MTMVKGITSAHNDKPIKRILRVLGTAIQKTKVMSVKWFIYFLAAATVLSVFGQEYLAHLGLPVAALRLIEILFKNPITIRLIDTIGGNLLAEKLNEIANNDALTDEEILASLEKIVTTEDIRSVVEEAISDEKLLTEREFYHAFARLITSKQEEHQELVQLLELILMEIDEQNRHKVEVPYQLPSRSLINNFVGRKSAREQIINELEAGNTLTITGPAGVGKSAVIAMVLWTLSDNETLLERFPDGVVWYDFALQSDMKVASGSIARIFGYRGTGDPNQVMELMAKKKALFVFDSVEMTNEIYSILTMSRKSCTVIIGRKSIKIDGKNIKLRELDTMEGTLFLKRMLDGADYQGKILEQLVTSLSGLPLSLVLASHQINKQGLSVDQYLQWLNSSLYALELAKNRQGSILVVLEQSVRALTQNAQRILLAMGAFALRPLTEVTLAATLMLKQEEYRHELIELIDSSLVRVVPTSINSEKFIRMYMLRHSLIFRYVREHLSEELTEEWNTILNRTMIITLRAFQSIINPDIGLNSIADVIYPDTLVLQDNLLREQRWAEVIQATNVIAQYIDRVDEPLEYTQLINKALIAAININDKEMQAKYYHQLGWQYVNLGEHNKAQDSLQKAMTISEELDNQELLAESLSTMAVLNYEQNKPENAFKLQQRAFSIARKIGNAEIQARVVGDLGVSLLKRGHTERALTILNEAIAYAKQENLEYLFGSLYLNLGDAMSSLGDTDSAITAYTEVNEIAVRSGERGLQILVYTKLGTIYHKAGNFDEAVKFYLKGLAISEELNDLDSIAVNLGNLGLASDDLGNLDESIEYFERALEIFKGINPSQADITQENINKLLGKRN